MEPTKPNKLPLILPVVFLAVFFGLFGFLVGRSGSKPLVSASNKPVTTVTLAIKPTTGETANQQTNAIQATTLFMVDTSRNLTVLSEVTEGINDVNWLDQNNLRVKAQVLVNCADEILGGAYRLSGNKLVLEYYVEDCQKTVCAKCQIGRDLVFGIGNINKADFDIELKEVRQ